MMERAWESLVSIVVGAFGRLAAAIPVPPVVVPIAAVVLCAASIVTYPGPLSLGCAMGSLLLITAWSATT